MNFYQWVVDTVTWLINEFSYGLFEMFNRLAGWGFDQLNRLGMLTIEVWLKALGLFPVLTMDAIVVWVLAAWRLVGPYIAIFAPFVPLQILGYLFAIMLLSETLLAGYRVYLAILRAIPFAG